MAARFYAPDANGAGGIVTLPAEEAAHLTRVLRLRAGDAVRVFNGRGGEFDAVVEPPDRRQIRVRLGERRAAAPESRVRVAVAAAALKGDKMDDVVRDAVMTGAGTIQPLLSMRSEVTAASLERGTRRQRWERVAISSAKQCGRAVVPAILEPCSLTGLANAIDAARLPAPAYMFVEPSASREAVTLESLRHDVPAAATLIVGPEGGWDPEELEYGASRWRLVTMRMPTIRADAMATIAMTALLAAWGEL